jgi:hypothetical protein
MNFQISGPSGAPVNAQGVDQALKVASSMLAMPKQHEPHYRRELEAGRQTAWAYGFNEVWITPVVQAAA